MQRTTTTATLLVTMAVAAVTGCVTVQRPPAPDPAPAADRTSAPRPDGPRRPEAVEPPARDSLERTEPSSEPDRGEAHGRAPGGDRPAAPRTGPGTGRRAEPPRRPAPPAAARPEVRPDRPARRPGPAPPKATRPAPGRRGADADLCGLGRTYGGWQPDSPEAVICRKAYGR
ncbi:hypothetical protein [Streptomyces daghestanicus]|uniref:hypothetical protein n=1 Tax=Streptomyces daghestanicus TaxID=66885 RepID=UPI0027E29CCE|nr:hypothetical protein [Streptomyces daghestanicus]